MCARDQVMPADETLSLFIYVTQSISYATAAKSLQLCLTLCNPMDCSPPGSSIHEIFQARVLEWGAITFSAISI